MEMVGRLALPSCCRGRQLEVVAVRQIPGSLTRGWQALLRRADVYPRCHWSKT